MSKPGLIHQSFSIFKMILAILYFIGFSLHFLDVMMSLPENFVHKWRNIEKALGEDSHKALGAFWAIRDAKDMAEAKVLSDRLESILRSVNRSALDSYLEAKEDLLAVHELKLSQSLKRFFSTTNAIESLNSMIEEDMRRVKLWRDSEHFQRWLATYCLASEKRMRRIRGHASVAALWVRLRTLTERQDEIDSREEVA